MGRKPVLLFYYYYYVLYKNNRVTKAHTRFNSYKNNNIRRSRIKYYNKIQEANPSHHILSYDFIS